MPQILPSGPALPPGQTMKFNFKVFLKTRLKILNENSRPASISVDGVGKFIPASDGSKLGLLDLSAGWHFGKTITITNQCDWVLKVEY